MSTNIGKSSLVTTSFAAGLNRLTHFKDTISPWLAPLLSSPSRACCDATLFLISVLLSVLALRWPTFTGTVSTCRARTLATATTPSWSSRRPRLAVKKSSCATLSVGSYGGI